MVEKTRNSVTLTKPYQDALTELVRSGMYIDKQDAIREGLRLLFRFHGIDPFKPGDPRPGDHEEPPGIPPGGS